MTTGRILYANGHHHVYELTTFPLNNRYVHIIAMEGKKIGFYIAGTS